MLSELRVGFQIGAALYCLFWSSTWWWQHITTSIGMLQLRSGSDFDSVEIGCLIMVDGWKFAGGIVDEKFCLNH